MDKIIEKIKDIFAKVINLTKKKDNDFEEEKKKLNIPALIAIIAVMLVLFGISFWRQYVAIKEEAIEKLLEEDDNKSIHVNSIDSDLFFVNNEEDLYLKGDFKLIRKKDKVFWNRNDFEKINVSNRINNFSKINNVLDNSFKELFDKIQ